jgi:uncharacterized membrane protein HdeD (DUF308 family)
LFSGPCTEEQLMSQIVVERRRSGWDVVFGILLVIAGIVILGDVVIATAVSVKFLGWMALIGGVIELISAFFRIKEGRFWGAFLGGALLGVLGIVILRNTEAVAVTLTLIAGCVFLVGGIVRIAAAKDFPEMRWVLVIGGVISVVLGLIVLFNLATASYGLLGLLLGVQALIEGFILIFSGRLRATAVA